MFKKHLLAFAILAASSCNVFAYSFPYVGAGVGWQNNGGYSGLLGNFFGGYGSTIGEKEIFYLGGELFLDFISIPINTNLNHRITYAYGAALLPGFYASANTLIYARIGLAATHWYKPEGTQTGAQLGAGLQVNLSQSLDLRLEYAYASSGFYEGFGSTRSSQINLALVYRLD